ncbi:MAG: ABC transporter permease subunit, partial [Acidobacteriota bacterium]
MRALFFKELRGHLPLLALVIVIFGGDFLYWPFAERLDEVSWVEQSGQLLPAEGKFYAIALLVLTLIAAYSAFPREHDEKTIEFLYALPIGRGQIFLAKALAVWAVMAVGVALDHLAGATVQFLNPQSFGGEQWRLGLAVRIAGIDAFFCAAMVAHGLLLSFLRRFGWLAAALIGYLIVLIKRHAPAHAYVDPSELLTFEYRGLELVMPWTGLLFHGVAAMVSGALAYLLWMGPAERLTLAYSRLETSRGGRVALGCVPFLLMSGGLVWMVAWAVEEGDDTTEQVIYRELLPVRAETRWFDFTYDSSQTAAAQALIRQADTAYERVAAAMGAELGVRIDADLTDLGDGHAGIAQGGVIRVALETLDAAEALHTLYHETVHSFQFHLAGGRVPEQADSIRTFVEGSAEYISHELLSDPVTRSAHRRLAAAAFDRHNIRF